MIISTDARIEVVYIRHDLIAPNPFQPRQIFSDEELEDLADSIRQHGILQPILVRPGRVTDSGETGYFLIAGERRWRASALVGLYEVPVIVRHVQAFEGGVLAAIENLQRVDTTPLEEADMILSLFAAAEQNGESLSLNELGKKLGKGRGKGWIQNRLDLISFDEDVRAMVAQRSDTLSHAREVESVRDPDMRGRLIRFALEGGAHLPLKALTQYIHEAGPYASDDELGRFIDLFERSHSRLDVLEQKIEQRLRDVEALRGTRGAPDAQTQFRSLQNSQTGGGNMSRGRHVAGVSPSQAQKEIKTSTDEMRRHLMNVAAWRSAAGGLSPQHRKSLNEARHLIEDLLSGALEAEELNAQLATAGSTAR